MKKILLLLLITSSCLGYYPVVQIPTYRATELRDVREEQLQRELKEERRRADRNANIHAGVQVVYVRDQYQENFSWLTTSDKNLIKYGLFGAIICLLILRK